MVHGNIDTNIGDAGSSGQTDNRDVVQLVNHVIDAYHSSAKSLWACAEYTWMLFNQHGKYEHQFTATLCDELAVNRDTIYHWRKAWDLRQRIGYFPGLTISHYYHAADYEDRMDDDFLRDFLEAARDNKMSVRAFATEIDMATNDSGTLPWLQKKLKGYLIKIENLYQSSETSGLPDHKRERLLAAIVMIKDVLRM